MLATIKAAATNTKVVYFTAGVLSTIALRGVVKGATVLTRAVKEQLAEQAAVKAAYEAEHHTAGSDEPTVVTPEPPFTPADDNPAQGQ